MSIDALTNNGRAFLMISPTSVRLALEVLFGLVRVRAQRWIRGPGYHLPLRLDRARLNWPTRGGSAPVRHVVAPDHRLRRLAQGPASPRLSRDQHTSAPLAVKAQAEPPSSRAALDPARDERRLRLQGSPGATSTRPEREALDPE